MKILMKAVSAACVVCVTLMSPGLGRREASAQADAARGADAVTRVGGVVDHFTMPLSPAVNGALLEDKIGLESLLNKAEAGLPQQQVHAEAVRTALGSDTAVMETTARDNAIIRTGNRPSGPSGRASAPQGDPAGSLNRAEGRLRRRVAVAQDIVSAHAENNVDGMRDALNGLMDGMAPRPAWKGQAPLAERGSDPAPAGSNPAPLLPAASPVETESVSKVSAGIPTYVINQRVQGIVGPDVLQQTQEVVGVLKAADMNVTKVSVTSINGYGKPLGTSISYQPKFQVDERVLSQAERTHIRVDGLWGDALGQAKNLVTLLSASEQRIIAIEVVGVNGYGKITAIDIVSVSKSAYDKVMGPPAQSKEGLQGQGGFISTRLLLALGTILPVAIAALGIVPSAAAAGLSAVAGGFIGFQLAALYLLGAGERSNPSRLELLVLRNPFLALSLGAVAGAAALGFAALGAASLFGATAAHAAVAAAPAAMSAAADPLSKFMLRGAMIVGGIGFVIGALLGLFAAGMADRSVGAGEMIKTVLGAAGAFGLIGAFVGLLGGLVLGAIF